MNLRNAAVAAALLGLVGAPAARPAHADDAPDVTDMVDAINGVFGSHQGYRAVHAKGFCAAGSFEPTPEAKGVSKAVIFDGRAVPVMYRFSIAPGTPAASDKDQAPRSLVARFQPNGGDTMDLLMINVPFVFVHDPKDFAPFFRALTPDPKTGKPDPAKFKAYFDQHPESQRFLDWLGQHPVPASYATARYYAVHTFYFTNDKGERRPARWMAEPRAGEAALADEQKKILGDDFYEDEMRQRVDKQPAEWDLYLVFAAPDDPLTDASSPWPADGKHRERVQVGRFRVGSVEQAGSKGPCDQEMFNPMQVVDGIEPSDDPVLKVRPDAYAVSFSRRMSQ
jgi:catalase